MIVIGFIFGTVLGSFIKALSDRSLKNKSFWGRSYCPKCHHKLAWYDLFPIFSYVLLGGKCRYCRAQIGMEHLLVEVAAGILVGFLFWQTPVVIALSVVEGWQSVFQSAILLLDLVSKIFFITVLVTLFLTDLKKMFIPDRIILPAAIAGIILGFIITIAKIGYLYFYLSQSVIGRLLLPPHSVYFQRHAAMIAEPFFFSILTALLIGGFFLSLIIITKGKGMGGGDVKLGVFLAVMLGFPNAVFALFLAFLTGAVFSLVLIILGKKHFGQTIPFGPFLVTGSLMMLFWGKRIVDWYLSFSF